MAGRVKTTMATLARLRRSRNVADRIPRGLRVLDVTLVLLGLPILLPFAGLIALAVFLDSPGPVIYRSQRIGKGGLVFEMLKFRTMDTAPGRVADLDEWAFVAAGEIPPSELAGLDRRTRLGALLRKLSIDELPQLWNVLRGDMSIVGPRPERAHYVELFEHAIYRYPDRHRVKSGLTGWSQVNGLRGETSLADRIEWDNFYIENWSPWLDLKILVKTIPALVVGRGAR